MATYRTIAASEVDAESPITQELMQALEANPTAIAEGASGAPTMEVAWHEVEIETPGADTDTVSFSTDISVYRAVRLIGGCALANASLTVDVDVNIGGTFRTLATATETGGTNNALILDVHVDNVDNNDSANQRITTGIIAFGNRGASDWDTVGAFAEVNSIANVNGSTGSATAIRVTVSGVNQIDVSEGAPNFRLYGIKRTQP